MVHQRNNEKHVRLELACFLLRKLGRKRKGIEGLNALSCDDLFEEMCQELAKLLQAK